MKRSPTRMPWYRDPFFQVYLAVGLFVVCSWLLVAALMLGGH